jgi:hypothetical protein
VALDAPDGWQTVCSPDVILAIKKDLGPTRFSPNIVCNFLRLRPPCDLAAIANNVELYLDSQPGFKVLGARSGQRGGYEWSVLEFANALEGAGTVIQTVASVAIPNGPFVDVLRIVGSISAEDQDKLEEFETIIANVEISLG